MNQLLTKNHLPRQLPSFPYVLTASEILEQRFWKHRIPEKYSILDTVERSRNQTKRTIQHQLASLSEYTHRTAKKCMPFGRIHPFEGELIRLTLGEGVYEGQLKQLKKIYAKFHAIGKEFERRVEAETTREQVADLGELCTGELKECVKNNAKELNEVAKMAKTLRRLPDINLETPIVAFFGAPNVGKSSLVKALSTAAPEVANYPFTTRGVTLGHLKIGDAFLQIADTPGLLCRPNEARNRVERFAVAVLELTPAAVAFVMDPTGHCGMSVKDQLYLRSQLLSMVPHKDDNWIDVVSKIDIEESLYSQVNDGTRISMEDIQFIEKAVRVSTESGENLPLLVSACGSIFSKLQ